MDGSRSDSSPRRRTQRRWRVPPAIVHGSEPLESAAILDEVGGAAGLVLWQSLRDVTLWASTPPEQREALFSPAAERKRIAALLTAGIEAPLEQPLGMITVMVGRPGRVGAERLAVACRRVSQWAERQRKLATALTYAQAAALVCPGNAAAGYKVGQLARRRAEHARAETWYRRAIALGRQEGDWISYSLALLGLGNLYAQRGNLRVARRFYLRGLRSARRHGLRDIQGRALHDLLVLATTVGRSRPAQHYARAAFEAYGPAHPLIPRLAHDVAYFWMTEGYFQPALAVFQALAPRLKSPAERLVVLPNLVRAAGGAERRDVFERSWKEMGAILDELDSSGSCDQLAEGLLEMARGAASLQAWERAVQSAERAAAAARGRGEARIEVLAESLLDSIRGERRVAEWKHEAPAGFDVEALADDFLRSLETAKAAS